VPVVRALVAGAAGGRPRRRSRRSVPPLRRGARPRRGARYGRRLLRRVDERCLARFLPSPIPTSPSHAWRVGPSLSPLKGGEGHLWLVLNAPVGARRRGGCRGTGP